MTDFYTLDDQGQVAALKQFSETALSHWSLEGSQLSLIKYRENAVFEVLTKRDDITKKRADAGVELESQEVFMT